MNPRRLAAWLSGLWGGLLLGVGLVGAPAGFATTTVEIAGRAAGRMFAVEAYLSLGLAVALCLLLRKRERFSGEEGAGSAMSADLMITLGVLFCTVAGYFALQPMMAAARAGQGSVSFAALHGASVGFYALKALLVLVLAWRLTAISPRPSS